MPFTAKTRMSGIDYNGNEIRKGAADAIKAYVDRHGGAFSRECEDIVKRMQTREEHLLWWQRTDALWAWWSLRTL